MWCSIFIASSTTRVWPAVTRSPAVTRTSSTVPGIGATNPPATEAAAGGANRGTTVSVAVEDPIDRWSWSPSRVQRAVARSPSTSTSTASGDQRWTRAVEPSPTRNEPSRWAR